MIRHRTGGSPWASGGFPQGRVLVGCTEGGNPFILFESYIEAAGQQRVFLFKFSREPSDIFLKVGYLLFALCNSRSFSFGYV